MDTFLHHVSLAAPLFSLVFVGYGLMRFSGWPVAMSDSLSRFVFSVAMPAMMFRLMSDFSKLPPVDARLLIAFFGGCLIVFFIGRLIAWKVFGMDGTAQSVFGLGGVFSNNVMLGLPLAKMALGDAAVPSVALVLIFNALILWTLVSLSVEWHRHGSLSLKGLRDTVQGVLRNPIILAILAGSAFGLSGAALPAMLDSPLKMLGQTGMPLALVALGMSLAEYNLKSEWKVSLAIVIPKLLILPLIVFGLARLLALPPLETRVIVLLASIGQGANVFLMARQFKAVEGGMAGALILSTALSAITTPLALAMAGS